MIPMCLYLTLIGYQVNAMVVAMKDIHMKIVKMPIYLYMKGKRRLLLKSY